MTTNYEKIKNMNIEEMAEYITDINNCDQCPISSLKTKIDCYELGCQKSMVKYLQQEATNE